MADPYPIPTSPTTRATPEQPACGGRHVAWAVAIALAINVIGQLVRLQQTDPLRWLAVDYGIRIAVLLALAAMPSTRLVVFTRERRRIGLLELIGWSLVIALGFSITHEVSGILTVLLPATRIGSYPTVHGGLYLLDLTLGLALVALHEELLFRRAMRIALAGVGNETRMILVSALLFGAYHWWTGVPNSVFAVAFGAAAMALYKRSGVLWPLVVLHYLVDLIAFA